MAREILRRPTALQINRARPLIESTVNEILAVPEMAYELLLKTDTNFSLHSHLVNSSVFTLALCGLLEISDPAEMHALALSGFLHDIGKALLPDQLLHKSGKLSTSEWALMRQHSLLGYNLLSGINGMPVAVGEAARSHHERIDGQGYPDGLSGDEIPFAARLTAVVDVFNALTTDTAFRKRMSSFEAITVMRDQMGGQFDTEVLKALVHTLREHASTAAN
jgi:HD-GYP domain-containing protein (c-di-GMP phosphodiesterase class II)